MSDAVAEFLPLRWWNPTCCCGRVLLLLLLLGHLVDFDLRQNRVRLLSRVPQGPSRRAVLSSPLLERVSLLVAWLAAELAAWDESDTVVGLETIR